MQALDPNSRDQDDVEPQLVQLGYRPVTASHSSPAFLPFLFGAAVLGAGPLWLGGGVRLDWTVVKLLPSAVSLALATYFWMGNRAWQYRIEDTTLSFRGPTDNGWATTDLDDIKAFLRIENDESQWYELVFQTGQRILVRGPIFEPWKSFQRCIKQIAPSISFGARNSGFCFQCNSPINSISRACNSCGACIPQALPILSDGDLTLPDGLERKM